MDAYYSADDMRETIQHLTDCQALLEDARGDLIPDEYNEDRKNHITKWRSILAPNETGPIFPYKELPNEK